MCDRIEQGSAQEPPELDTATSTAIYRRFAILFDDDQTAPFVFAGKGAENAALQTFRSKSATSNCRFFAEILPCDLEFVASKHVCDAAAIITVQPSRQVHAEILNNDQSSGEVRSFDRMTDARSWLSAKGLREDQITIRVERVCDRSYYSAGYSGIFHCANCQRSCLE